MVKNGTRVDGKSKKETGRSMDWKKQKSAFNVFHQRPSHYKAFELSDLRLAFHRIQQRKPVQKLDKQLYLLVFSF